MILTLFKKIRKRCIEGFVFSTSITRGIYMGRWVVFGETSLYFDELDNFYFISKLLQRFREHHFILLVVKSGVWGYKYRLVLGEELIPH